MEEKQTTLTDSKTAEAEVKNKVLYDLYLLMSPASTTEELNAAQNKIAKVLTDNSANIEASTKFVKSDLSYPINKNWSSYTQSVSFWADPESIKQIRHDIKTQELNILRYLISKKEKKATPKHARKTSIGMPLIGSTQTLKREKESVPPEKFKEEEKQEAVKRAQEPQKVSDGEKASKDKVTLEDIDKKLDEIMGDL